MAMSERERMNEFWFQKWSVGNFMVTARNTKRDKRFLSDLNTDQIVKTNVQMAREANRQAVRIWWRLDEVGIKTDKDREIDLLRMQIANLTQGDT